MGSSGKTSTVRKITKPPRVAELETTTRSVQRLVSRQSVLVDPSHDPDNSADTLGVMLRLGPQPVVMLCMNSNSQRARIASVLTRMSVTFVQSSASHGRLEFPVGTPTILLTDNLELVRRLRADRSHPQFQCLYLEADANSDPVEAILAGADDGISHDAGADVLRARLLVASRYAHLEASFRALLRENRELSTIDGLTKVANRRFFERHYPLEMDRAYRYRRPMALIMCDIDHFKRINDTFGHVAGDDVLREFGSRLQQALRQGIDWVARVGGEEFAIVLPETGLAAASQVAETLRERVRGTRFRLKDVTVAVTASFGVCELPAGTARSTGLAERLQSTADAALYRSKHEGRDRVAAVSLDAQGGVTKTRR